jgi:hypothetical protein
MRRLQRSRARLCALAVTVATLACATTAMAAHHHYSERPTAAGTQLALAVVPVKSDFAKPASWVGGPVAGELIVDQYCNDYAPRYSDLVVTGKAISQFVAPGTFIRTWSMILATKQMVRLQWQRTVQAPHWFDCARLAYAQAKAPTRFISMRRLTLPKIAPYVSGTRTVMEATRADGKTMRVAVDTLQVARGRTEILQIVTSPLAAGPAQFQGEMAMLEKLIGRARV